LGFRKVKYTAEEVEYMLGKNKEEYEKKLLAQKEINKNLTEQLNSVKAELETLKGKELLILATLERAEKTAMELESSINEQYQLEVERLKRFVARWNGYFRVLKDDYPQNPTVKKAINIKDKVDAAAGSVNAKKLIADIDGLIGKSKKETEENKEKFNPKEKIRDYIVATGDNGFNLEEVLNPGELQLEDICKELGLMGGNE
jgi:hypothetical protein